MRVSVARYEVEIPDEAAQIGTRFTVEVLCEVRERHDYPSRSHMTALAIGAELREVRRAEA